MEYLDNEIKRHKESLNKLTKELNNKNNKYFIIEMIKSKNIENS